MRKLFLVVGGLLAVIVISLLIGAAPPQPIFRNQFTTNYPGNAVLGNVAFYSATDGLGSNELQITSTAINGYGTDLNNAVWNIFPSDGSALFANGKIALNGDGSLNARSFIASGTNAGTLILWSSNNLNYVSVAAFKDISSNLVIRLPTNGMNGRLSGIPILTNVFQDSISGTQQMQVATIGSGLTFDGTTLIASGTPGGAFPQLQFQSLGTTFGGTTNITFDLTNKVMKFTPGAGGSNALEVLGTNANSAFGPNGGLHVGSLNAVSGSNIVAEGSVTANAGGTNFFGPTIVTNNLQVLGNLNAATNIAAFNYITNPIVSGVFWTNLTTARLTLFINFTLTDSTVSGSPSLNMTNVANGDWMNATNNFVLTGTSSGRASFLMSPNDWVIVTNKSSGNASASMDSSFAYKQ